MFISIDLFKVLSLYYNKLLILNIKEGTTMKYYEEIPIIRSIATMLVVLVHVTSRIYYTNGEFFYGNLFSTFNSYYGV